MYFVAVPHGVSEDANDSDHPYNRSRDDSDRFTLSQAATSRKSLIAGMTRTIRMTRMTRMTRINRVARTTHPRPSKPGRAAAADSDNSIRVCADSAAARGRPCWEALADSGACRGRHRKANRCSLGATQASEPEALAVCAGVVPGGRALDPSRAPARHAPPAPRPSHGRGRFRFAALADSELADSELADSELADSELADSEMGDLSRVAASAGWASARRGRLPRK